MTKRSAMTMAAGLAFALLAGVVAISLTLGSTPAANASRERKPLIKHQEQTVTVHRKAASTAPAPVRVVHLPPTVVGSSPMGSSSAASFDGQGPDFEGSGDATFDDGSSGGSPSTQGSFGDD
jgi:hypothetical protein